MIDLKSRITLALGALVPSKFLFENFLILCFYGMDPQNFYFLFLSPLLKF